MVDSNSLDDIASIQNFPCGRKSQNILRKNLLDTDNPSSTITQTREENSLHSFVSKAFGTLSTLKPNESTGHTVSSSIKRTTRGEIQQLERIKSKGDVIEDFQPESVLEFCKHLGVSRYEIHKAISDNLKSALEYEIEKVDVSKSKEFLLDLLKSSFQFINVPDLKSVFVTIVKKLGDATPVEVLELLASKSTKNPNELKYSELFNTFSLDVKRLVWEADWDATVRPDGLPVEKLLSQLSHPSKFATLAEGDKLLIEIVKPSIESYLHHDPLKNGADLAYTSNNRDKRVDTEARRMPISKTTKDAISVTSSGMITSLSSKLSALTKIEKSGDKQSSSGYNPNDQENNVPYLVLSALKETIGSRPKLLAALLNILIAEHGKHVDEENIDTDFKLVNGADSLHCTLVSDILLFNGQLPKYYEDVRLLAQTLDKCVQIGIISDQAIGQIQGLLRSIFQPDRDKDQQSLVQKEKMQRAGNTSIIDNGEEATAKSDVERQFELKLLRKIIKASVMAMKECDPQGLFLNPVTDDIAPGYSSVIKKMMCIRIIEEKAVNLKYDTLDQFETDVQLMFQNCIKYNVGKDGSWFRGEARRQQKKWRDEILTQAKDIYREEMNKRKKQLDNAAASNVMASTKALEENKKKAILEQQRKILLGAKENAKKRKFDTEFNDEGSTGNNGSAKLIRPLKESSTKKRKKDSFCPSLPALASMLLSDPFVVRLLFDKVLRAIRSDVLKEKTIPADHGTIPSVLQLIHIASLSPKVCATRGSAFVVPDVGLMSKSASSNENDGTLSSRPFFLLRNQLPRLGNLILTADIDRRIISGDLSILPPLPKTKLEQWQFHGCSNRILLDLVQGSLVHLIQSGVANDNVLTTQCSRFIVAIDALSRGNMNNERCFFLSLIHALLRYKAKLPHTVRDLIVKAWLQWIKTGGLGNGITMTSAVHSCFAMLLNQWLALGNLILPVDTMIMWSEEAIRACELNVNDKCMNFSKYWTMDDENFREVKLEYEKMLKAMPEDRAIKWKESVGIVS
jgi:bromodomain-containing protein 7/9